MEWKNPLCEELFNKLVNHEEKYSLLTVEENAQEIKEVTWKDIWDIIRSEHWHNTAKASCPHDESLFEHLCRCGELCYEKAVAEERENPKIYFYTGLLHDLGKPGTRIIRGKRTSFKGHALVGGSLIQHLWSPKLGDALDLTADDWASISTATDVHMCGYFADMCLPLHLDCFRLLSFPVRRLIQILRYGDILALTPRPGEDRAEEMQKTIDTHDWFQLQTTVPILNVSEKYGFDNGVLIQIQGQSGSGKSTLRSYIKNYLNGISVVEVVRDDIMVETVLKDRGQNIVTDYGAELYKECYDYYQEKRDILSKRVNLEMMTRIREGLLQGYVVITDTLATAYEKPAKAILPVKELEHAFKISFWTSRGPELFIAENSRHGMSVETQVKVHGKRALLNPLTNLEDFGAVTSVTEVKQVDMKQSWIRPHLSLTTNWNGIKRREINNVLEHVKASYKYCQSLPRKLTYGTSQRYSLRELVEILFSSGGIEEVKDFFTRYMYNVSVVDENVVGIKYIDSANNLWRSTWAREARGRFFYCDPEKKTVTPLKETLQRGAELLTKTHVQKQTDETQDITSKRFDHLDDIQQELINILQNETSVKIDGILSCKVDGMLLLLNFYPPECEQHPIIKSLLTGNRLHLTLADGTLVVFSTQGTLFAGETVWSYLITAFCGEIGIEIENQSLQPLKLWKQIANRIQTWCQRLYDSLNMKKTMINLAAEMVCKNRTTYNGNMHPELAVTYNSSFVALLGIFYNGKYIPHADLPQTKSLITHPGFIRIQETSQIHDAVQDLETVIIEGKPLASFAGKWFGDATTPVHAEGFVYLHRVGNVYDYSKIKLPVYYMLHKLKKTNIPFLLSLPNTVDEYFPSLVALRRFTADLHKMLIDMVMKLYNEMHVFLSEGQTAPWIEKMNERAKARFEKYRSQDVTQEDLKVVYAICMREGIDTFREKFIEISSAILGTFTPAKKDSFLSLASDLLLRTSPWLGESHASDVIHKLIEKKDKLIGNVWDLMVATPP